jgi:uncharacterized membrane protein YkvA (DUF1232 family)
MTSEIKTEEGLLAKLEEFIKFILEMIVYVCAAAAILGLTLAYAAIDPKTPWPIRLTILGPLAYLVSPLDAVPDFTPWFGFSDDIGVMTAAIALLGAHVTEEHRAKAKKRVDDWRA